MKLAQKKGTKVAAYELGAGSSMEFELMREGKIKISGEGKFLLSSLEGTEEAKAGDFFKVSCLNGEKFPYPNSRIFFSRITRRLATTTISRSQSPFWFGLTVILLRSQQ